VAACIHLGNPSAAGRAVGGDVLHDVGICAALGVVYLVLALATLALFEKLARGRATLALA